ncbi:MAG: response regulator [Chrysiogenetes bacterium]|nr:response regulator [Chrysiogenetes bacterium]
MEHARQIVDTGPRRRTKVLLVDDQQTQIMFEQMLLGSEEFEYVIARNGREALDMARAERPDLILMDVMMPEMDGIEAVGKLREDDATAGIPIIMVTTRGEEDYVERAYSNGCVDYITKPIQRGELLTKIQALTAGR